MTFFIAIITLIGFVVIIYRAWDKAKDDAQAMYWASVREPLIFISETAFDTGLEARAKEARENLVKHGNKFLVHPNGQVDVWTYVYRVHMNILTNVQALDATHSVWYDEAVRTAANRKAAWIAQRSEWIGNNAGRTFGGQIVNN